MRITIAAIGKLKASADRELLERYTSRISSAGRSTGFSALDLIELPESRAATPAARKADEAARLLARTEKAGVRILLDERGKSLTSQQFAAELGRLRDGGDGDLAFLLGGPDGHADTARSHCRLMLSLGPMTLPHGLARIVLAEQIYRTIMILSGHPYHRD